MIPIALGFSLHSSAQQQNVPRLGYVSPAGAQQGASLMVLVGGQFLEGANNVLLSGEGVEARVVEYFKPIRQGQANSVRDKLKRLLDKKAQAQAAAAAAPPPSPPKPGSPAKPAPPRPPKVQWTAADEMQVAALRQKFAAALKGPAVPATAESVLVQITVTPEASVGLRELRLETPKGWTNPLVFCIGQFKEFSKEPPDLALDAKPKPKSPTEPLVPAPEPPTRISLPCVANGQIAPGGADRFTFDARKGQRLVIAALTRTLIPYISDAVPGWFQGALTLSDASGSELAYADHYLFDPEPVLLQEIPKDGAYTIEIRDALYRGREDFVYRLVIGELPFISSVFPLGGKSGEKTAIELSGWNLPAEELVLDYRDHPPGIYPIAAEKNGASSNAVPFAVDDLPEESEEEPNGKPETAQEIQLPLILNGRVEKGDDRDLFTFRGKAGQEIVAEVQARRLRSPLDSLLVLADSAGRQIALNDDHEDKASGLNTHHSDSYLRATLPADGTYCLHLTDTQHNGGPEYAYRLRVSPPRPDFELRLAPSHIIARAGATVPVTVFALRKDGFAGAIDFALRDASEGLSLSGGPLAPDKDQVDLTLKVLYWTGKEAMPRLRVEGQASADGREIRREAVPAEHMTQAFEYKHLVPTDDLRMTVTGRVAPRISIKISGSTPVKIPLGQSATVKLAVSPPKCLEGTTLQWAGKPPQGIELETFQTSDEGIELVVRCDPAKVKPGSRGNLSFVAAEKPPSTPPDKRTAANQQRFSPPRLPSIPYQVVEPAGK